MVCFDKYSFSIQSKPGEVKKTSPIHDKVCRLGALPYLREDKRDSRMYSSTPTQIKLKVTRLWRVKGSLYTNTPRLTPPH